MKFCPLTICGIATTITISLVSGATPSIVHAQSALPRTVEALSQVRPGTTKTHDDEEIVDIRRKLASIVIPSIEFHATTLGDAVEYIRQEGRRLDRDPDPEARGVNIFLKLPTAKQAVATPSVTPSSDVSSLGSATGGETGGPLFCPPVPSVGTRITLTMNRIPLLEALKYVASQAGLKVKVEPYAVSLVPLAEDADTLVTATFHVPPSMIGNVSSGTGKSALDQPAAPAQ